MPNYVTKYDFKKPPLPTKKQYAFLKTKIEPFGRPENAFLKTIKKFPLTIFASIVLLPLIFPFLILYYINNGFGNDEIGSYYSSIKKGNEYYEKLSIALDSSASYENFILKAKKIH